MSKGQTRLLVILQICAPRGVVVAAWEEVAVGSSPAHVPGMRFGPRLDEIKRFHAGVRRPESQVFVARAEDGGTLLLRGERSIQNLLVGRPARNTRALLELEPRLPANPGIAKERVRLCVNQNFTAPSRHRHDAFSIAWRCRFLTARRSHHSRIAAEKMNPMHTG